MSPKPKNFLINCLLVSLALGFTLFLVEFVLYFTDMRMLIPMSKLETVEWKQFYYENDSNMGFDIVKNFKNGRNAFRDGSHEIFSNAIRCFDTDQEVPEDYILLIGDSFTWGYAPFKSKWGTVLENLLDYRVVKCGIEGTGTKHQILKAKKVIKDIGHPPRIIVVGYFSNDFADDIGFPSTTVINGYQISNVKSVNMQTGELTRYTDFEMKERYSQLVNDSKNLLWFIRDNSVVANMLWNAIKNSPLQGLVMNLSHIYHVNLHKMTGQGVQWIDQAWDEHLQDIDQLVGLANTHGAQIIFLFRIRMVFMSPTSKITLGKTT